MKGVVFRHITPQNRSNIVQARAQTKSRSRFPLKRLVLRIWYYLPTLRAIPSIPFTVR
jgi:hypothetical protein